MAIVNQFFHAFESAMDFGFVIGKNVLHSSDLGHEKISSEQISFNQLVNCLMQSVRGLSGAIGVLRKMLDLDTGVEIPEHQATSNLASLEQLASRLDNLFHCFLFNLAGRLVNIEPQTGLYNLSSLFDSVAYTLQPNRSCTANLFRALESMKADKKIKIIEVQRLGFGSLMKGVTTSLFGKNLDRFE